MDEYVNFILENFRYESYVEADRALKMHYETTFGIFDHRAQTLQGKRPFSSQAYHAGYDKGPQYAFTYLVKSYVEHQVKEFLDLSFSDYCTLSHDQMNQLHETLGEIRRRKREEDEIRGRDEERRMQAILHGGVKTQSPGVNARAMLTGMGMGAT